MNSVCAGAIASVLLIAQPAAAQAEDNDVPVAVAVTGSATLTTDYRFRGVSQTDTKPAFKGGITVARESGICVGTDISASDAANLQPGFSKGQDGTGSIANGAVVASLTASF